MHRQKKPQSGEDALAETGHEAREKIRRRLIGKRDGMRHQHLRAGQRRDSFRKVMGRHIEQELRLGRPLIGVSGGGQWGGWSNRAEEGRRGDRLKVSRESPWKREIGPEPWSLSAAGAWSLSAAGAWSLS